MSLRLFIKPEVVGCKEVIEMDEMEKDKLKALDTLKVFVDKSATGDSTSLFLKKNEVDKKDLSVRLVTSFITSANMRKITKEADSLGLNMFYLGDDEFCFH